MQQTYDIDANDIRHYQDEFGRFVGQPKHEIINVQIAGHNRDTNTDDRSESCDLKDIVVDTTVGCIYKLKSTKANKA